MAIADIFKIKAAEPEIWFKSRLGSFVNTLPEDFVQVQNEINKALEQEPGLQKQYSPFFLLNDPHERMSPEYFVTRLFGFSPDFLRDKQSDPQFAAIIATLKKAEKALLRHIVVCGNRAFKLRCSSIIVQNRDLSLLQLLKKPQARFTASEYLAELKAAGVPPRVYKRRPEIVRHELVEQNLDEANQILALYQALPESVKDLFFSVSMDGDLNRELPLYLARDLILFADDRRWKELKKVSDSGDKKAFNALVQKFIKDFLVWQRQQNGFRLGAARGVNDDINSRDMTPRETSFLELAKPVRWIGKSKQILSDV